MIRKCNYEDVSGYATVEIVSNTCEVGEDCDGLKAGCPFAYKSKDHKACRRAEKIFYDLCKRLEAGLMS